MSKPKNTIVCDDSMFEDIFREKPQQPLSGFHIYSNYTGVMRAFKYAFTSKVDWRNNDYRLIKDLFDKHSREPQLLFKEYVIGYGARTAMDLFLQAKNYPKDSEILMTAISTEGMIETVKGKGYPNRNDIKIVPVDIQLDTMGPSLHDIKSKITKNTVAIILSYPYGIIYNIEQIASFCKSYGIDVIEDATEAFSGLSVTGSPYADLTLLSFGMLRHMSCFGGGVAIVRHLENEETYQNMLEIEK